MKSLWSVAVLLVLLTANSEAAVDWREGNWWIQCPRSQRANYVAGVFDGLVTIPALMAGEYPGEKVMAQLHDALPKIFQGMDVEKVIYGLDAFYAEKKNRSIPIGAGVMYLAIARSNLPEAEKRSTLKELRSKSH